MDFAMTDLIKKAIISPLVHFLDGAFPQPVCKGNYCQHQSKSQPFDGYVIQLLFIVP
jgi:hypothetical protein